MKYILLCLIGLQTCLAQTNNFILPYKVDVNLEESKIIDLKIDEKKTTLNLFVLSMVSLLPIVAVSFTRSFPESRREIAIGAGLLSIPSALGWTVFFRDYKKYKKGKLKPRGGKKSY